MLWRFVLTVYVFLTMVLPVWGEIVAPEKAEVGKLIPISSAEDADIYIWAIPEGIDSLLMSNNKELVCTGLEGIYKFQLTTVKLDWDMQTYIVSPLQSKLIVIGKVVPPVPPTPPPPPTPEPVLTGLAKDVYGWGKEIENHRNLSSGLSANYKTVATKYAGMTLTIEQAMTQLRDLNNKVLDAREKKDAWAVFGSRLEEKLTVAWPMNKPTFVKFLNDVSLGLSFVK